MRQYQVTDTLIETKRPLEKGLLLTVLTTEELEQENDRWEFDPRTLLDCRHIRMCKADGYRGYEFVTLHLYRGRGREKQPLKAACYLLPKQMVLVEEEGQAYDFLEQLMDRRVGAVESPGELLCELLEDLVARDFALLEHMEEQISALEELVLGEKTVRDFNRKMMRIRKALLHLHSSYERLMNVSQELEENQNKLLTAEAVRKFHHFTSRMERMSGYTQMLREYSMQVREIYQSQIDIRQNQIMKVLTVVTTVFLPLSLIAGWYGMNFSGMPELQWPFGYPLVILISVLVVAVTCWFFKKKHYF